MISKYRNYVEQQKGKRDHCLELIQSEKALLKSLSRSLKNTEAAQLIIQTVARQTQDELKFHISDIVSAALAAVFDDPYEFEVDFVIKRGKTECEMYFVRGGERTDPMDASGGGAVDVASFALRIACWSISQPKPNNTIILDEPFRFLSSELQPKAGEMLKMLSEKLGLQFIIVTHNNDLIDAADNVFTVKMKNRVSEVVC